MLNTSYSLALIASYPVTLLLVASHYRTTKSLRVFVISICFDYFSYWFQIYLNSSCHTLFVLSTFVTYGYRRKPFNSLCSSGVCLPWDRFHFLCPCVRKWEQWNNVSEFEQEKKRSVDLKLPILSACYHSARITYFDCSNSYIAYERPVIGNTRSTWNISWPLSIWPSV